MKLSLLNSGSIPALRLNGLQNGWTMNAGAAGPGATTVTYTITTTLAEAMSVNVPAGKKMVLCQLLASSGLSTSQLLTVELEIDGVTVLSGTVTPASTSLHFVGNSSTNMSYDIDRLLVNSNFKLRIRTASGTQASIPFQYRYFLV